MKNGRKTARDKHREKWGGGGGEEIDTNVFA